MFNIDIPEIKYHRFIAKECRVAYTSVEWVSFIHALTHIKDQQSIPYFADSIKLTPQQQKVASDDQTYFCPLAMPQ